jgi:proteasome lid subunit RPN8/RPN11
MNLLYEKIKEHCLINPEIESCGLIIENAKGLMVEPCKNISEFPRHHFLISSEEQKEKEYKGKLKAFYHSHIDETDFSWLDKAVSESTKLDCLVYQIPTEKLLEYKPSGWKAPYVGRPFVPEIFDCYELVKDYYKKELNLTLGRPNHPFKSNPSSDIKELTEMGYYENNPWLFDYFTNNGFSEVQSPEKHDILLIKTDTIKCPVHCLIWFMRDRVLHQPGDRKSVV